MSTLRSLKVAVPVKRFSAWVTVTVVTPVVEVPLRTPPEGLLAMETPTLPATFVNVESQASFSVTVTAGGEIGLETTVCDGWPAKTSFAAVRDASAVPGCSVKSFPVPLKSFDCLTALVHVHGLDVHAKSVFAEAAVTCRYAVEWPPGGMAFDEVPARHVTT